MSGSLGVHALVRRAHEERVLAILRERGGLSRAQIAARSGLSRTTLSEITGDLLSRGAIVVVNTDAPRRAGSGRPAELLALDPRSGQFLGVDLGHTRVRVAVADAAHEIIASEVTPYPADSAWPQRLATGVALIERVARERGITLAALQGIGVGVAGPYPAGAARADVQAAFAERFAAPIVVDNNTRFAALAEASLSEARDVLYIRLADGIGGGLVVGGRLVAGAGGMAGEFGHVKADPSGGLCRCGKRGCLETVAAVGPALAAAGVRDLDELTARRDEPRVRAAMDRVADAVGRVLASAALILDPEQIVIGGPLAAAAPGIVTRVATAVAAELVAVRPGPPPASAGSDESGAARSSTLRSASGRGGAGFLEAGVSGTAQAPVSRKLGSDCAGDARFPGNWGLTARGTPRFPGNWGLTARGTPRFPGNWGLTARGTPRFPGNWGLTARRTPRFQGFWVSRSLNRRARAANGCQRGAGRSFGPRGSATTTAPAGRSPPVFGNRSATDGSLSARPCPHFCRYCGLPGASGPRDLHQPGQRRRRRHLPRPGGHQGQGREVVRLRHHEPDLQQSG
ncbi:ROK family transcriptional regulator [Paractinoplanes durhamensis]|nr:ROK family transcriptional regulator [Actinoplanes durhamensis]